MWDPLLSPSGPAGVTTVITGTHLQHLSSVLGWFLWELTINIGGCAGNCGVGCAPTRATHEDREFMIGMLGALSVTLFLTFFGHILLIICSSFTHHLLIICSLSAQLGSFPAGAIEDIPADVLRQGTKWDVDGTKVNNFFQKITSRRKCNTIPRFAPSPQAIRRCV